MQHQVESGLLLDVVVRQSAAILLASKDKTLLVWGNAFFILNLGLHIFNSVWGLHFQSDGFASQGLHRDLHATSQTQNQMEGGLFLDVVVRQCDQRFPSPGLSWREPAFHPGGPWKMTVQMLGLSCWWETVQGWRKKDGTKRAWCAHHAQHRWHHRQRP